MGLSRAEYQRRWYTQAKAAHRPSYQRHLARMRQYAARHALERCNRRAFGDYDGPLLGCCGSWRRIDSVPFRCPDCGSLYFE